MNIHIKEVGDQFIPAICRRFANIFLDISGESRELINEFSVSGNLWRLVLRETLLSIMYIRNQTPEICLEAVKQYGWALQFVKEQTPEICLEAVKQNGLILQYVKEQTEKICLESVKQDGMALQYVKEQTEKICLEAVKQDGKAKEFTKDHKLNSFMK